jgi:UDP-glucose 4-epimerase
MEKIDVTKNIKVLIIGMSGGLARITAEILVQKYPHWKIVGVDSRPLATPLEHPQMSFTHMLYTRGNFEKIFRPNEGQSGYDIVFHLGRMGVSQYQKRSYISQRLNLNVMGTGRILDLCQKYNVKKMIILSTYHVYGANPDNPVFIKEDAVLKGSIKYPELRDVVEMDQLCTNWMWKNKSSIETLVFRPCSIIGPQIKNAMVNYLLTPYAPLAIDFNPMFQFIHEFDMANLLVESIEGLPTGIYNAAPTDVISINEAKKHLAIPTIPVALFMMEQLAKILNKTLWKIPGYFLDYLKYSCIIDTKQLHEALPHFKFRFNSREALEQLKMS